MNALVRKTLNLEQYQCCKCGRLFYINTMDRTSMDLDFGCPYGCDDNGRYVQDIKTEIKEVIEITKNKGD